LPPNPVSIDRLAAHRPRLPLSLVPTRDRYSPRAQRPLRGGSSRAHRGRAGDHRYAIGQRKRPEDRALPHLQGRHLEQLPQAGRAVRFVRVGTLDDPDRCPPDIHIFTSSKQPWVTLRRAPRLCRNSMISPPSGRRRAWSGDESCERACGASRNTDAELFLPGKAESSTRRPTGSERARAETR
jgi:hypothetical protein